MEARSRHGCHSVVATCVVFAAASQAWFAFSAFTAPQLSCRAVPCHNIVPRTRVHAAPWDALKGTWVDPNYWKQQYFLAGRLKRMLPERNPQMCALELCPASTVNMGYLSPDKNSGMILDKYFVLGDPDSNLQNAFTGQATSFRAEVKFAKWEPGKRAAALSPDLLDVAMVAPGTCMRIGGTVLQSGLTEVARAMKYDARVLLVCDEDDEAVLGGRFEAILEAQDFQDVEELRDIQIADGETAPGQIIRDAGLRLVRVVRDECGLSVGICTKREEERAPKAVRKQAGARKTRSASSAGRPAPRAAGGRGRKVSQRRR